MDVDQRNIIVGLGELLWDCFPSGRRPGGAPANVAYHADQLGARGVVCSRVGRDTDGDALCAYLAERGLSAEFVQRDVKHPTGTVTVDVSRPDHPIFTIHEQVAWDYLEYNAALAGLMDRAQVVCFGTLAQRHPASRETIRQALAAARRALIVCDVNLRQNWYTRESIEQSLAAAHVVKLNVDEARVLDALFEYGAHDPVDFAARLTARYDISLVCVTRGADGCLLVGDGDVADVPGCKVTVADAVGAGDAFCAALITARLAAWPLQRCAEFANEVGALVASRPGAMPDVAREYAELRRRYASGAAKPKE